MTTVSDGLYQWGGVPVGSPIFSTASKAWFVRPGTGNDGNSGRRPTDAFKTLAKALSKATANKGEVVYLIAESNTAGSTTDYQSVALDWNKDGVHLVGVGCGAIIGSRARISNLSTATAIVNGLFILSANNCFISNLEIFHGQGGTNPTGASIAMLISGQRNKVVDCQISGIGHSELDDATSRSLTITGAENIVQHCYIGLDTTIRATATSEVDVANARNILENCIISSYTSLSTFKALTILTSTVGRFVMLRECILTAVQNISSAVAPTGAIIHGAVSGNTVVLGGAVAGYAAVSTLDDANIFLNGPIGGTAKAGLATGVDAA